MDSDKYVTDEQPAGTQQVTLQQTAQTLEMPNPKHWRLVLLWTVVAVAFVSLLTAVALNVRKSSQQSNATKDDAAKVQQINLEGISSNAIPFKVGTDNRVVINGQLQASQGFILTPSTQPTTTTFGQIYVDQETKQIRYFNGQEFVTLASDADVTRIASQIGPTATAGVGGVTSLQDQTGALTLLGSGGLSIAATGSDITLSLPQNLTTSASPQFAGLTLSGNGGSAGITAASGVDLNLIVGSTTALSVKSGGDVAIDTSTLYVDATNNRVGVANLTPGNTLSVNAPATADGLAQLLVSTGAAGNKGLVVQGSASQTGNLLELQASTGTSLFRVDSGGNLILATGNVIYANTLQQTASGNDLTISAGANQLNLVANGITFQFPSTGANGQTICTTGVTCASGGGQAVILAPDASGVAAAQTNNSTDHPSIFINANSASSNSLILRLQGNGSDVLTLSQGGTLTLTGAQVTSGPTTLTNAAGIALTVNNGAGTSDIVSFQDNSTPVFRVADGGVAIFRNSVDSTAAFQIQNAAGASILLADTTNSIIAPGFAPGFSSFSRTTATISNTLNSNDFAKGTRMVIGGDNKPVIASYDSDDFKIIVSKCNNSDCTSGSYTQNYINIILPPASGKNQFAITTGKDNLPTLVIHQDNGSGGNIYVVHCNDNACSSYSQQIVKQSVTNGSGHPQIVKSLDGYPIVFYDDSGDTWSVKCGDDTCSSRNYDSGGATFHNMIGPDVNSTTAGATVGWCNNAGNDYGCPILAQYSNGGNDDVIFTLCSNSSCTSAATPVTVSDGAADYSQGAYLSIAAWTDNDGNSYPIILRTDGTGSTGTAVTIKCRNYTCTSTTDVRAFSSGTVHTSSGDIMQGANHYPLVAYQTGNNTLTIVQCITATCSANATPSTVTGGSDIGRYTSVAVGPFGYPMIASIYSDGNPDFLALTTCLDAACSLDTSIMATGGVQIGSSGQYLKSLQALYINDLLPDANFRVLSTGDIIANSLQANANGSVGVQSNLSNAFSVTNSSTGATALNVNSVTGALTLGSSSTATSPLTGSLVLKNANNAFDGTIVTSNSLTANNTYTLPALTLGNTATICTTDGNCLSGSGGSNLQSSYDNSSVAPTPEILLNATQGSLDIQDAVSTLGGNLLTVRDSNSDLLFGVGSTGTLTVGTANTTTGAITFNNSGSAYGVTLRSGATAGSDLTLTLPTADGSSGYCLETDGAGALSFQACANAALSNLSSVALNTSLLPNTAGAIDLGSATKPFANLYLSGSSGTPGTNNFTFTGVALAPRTITLPDESGTICYRNSANCGFAADTPGGSGSGAYIQNQFASPQSANFVIQSADTSQETAIMRAALGQSANIVAVQDSSNNNLLSVNSAGTVIIGYGVSPTVVGGGSGQLFVTSTAEFNGRLLIGTASNGIDIDSTNHQLRRTGTARNTLTLQLHPEYTGAVLNGTGIGTMTSDFCSGSSRLSINTSVCTSATEERNYYSWTTTQGSAQDYYIYVRVRLPSDFNGFSSDASINMYGWRTTANDSVTLTFYNASGGVCGSGTVVSTSNTTWTETALTGSETSDAACIAGGSGMNADDVVMFRIKMTATNGNFARAGSIRFSYYSNY